MSNAAKMVIDDLSKMHLLTADMQRQLKRGGIATVNIMAALARKEAIKNLKSEFTLRNTFTARNVRFTPMAENPNVTLSAIQSFAGVTEKAGYMQRQEEGGKHTPSSGNTLAIPTAEARGGSDKNPVRPGMRVGKMRKEQRVHGHGTKSYASQKAWNVARAAVAYTKNLFLPYGGNGDNRNLHRVAGFEKGSGSSVRFKLKQVYKFDTKETDTPAKPWFVPACEKAAKECRNIWISQMKKLGM
jgi:hypothetical protein